APSACRQAARRESPRVDGANRDRTGDLLLANSAAQEVSRGHWASMAGLTRANRRLGCCWWPLFSESASSLRRPKTASQLRIHTRCVVRVACCFQKNGKPGASKSSQLASPPIEKHQKGESRSRLVLCARSYRSTGNGCAPLHRGHGKEAPLTGHTFELVCAAVGELDSRA